MTSAKGSTHPEKGPKSTAAEQWVVCAEWTGVEAEGSLSLAL